MTQMLANETITADTVFDELDTFMAFVAETDMAREIAPNMMVTFGALFAEAAGNVFLPAFGNVAPGKPFTGQYIANTAYGQMFDDLDDDTKQDFATSRFDRAMLDAAFPAFVEGLRTALEAPLTRDTQTFNWEWTFGPRVSKASLLGYLFGDSHVHYYLGVDYYVDGKYEMGLGFKVSPNGFRNNVG